MRVLKRIGKSLIGGEDVVKLGWLIAAWHVDHLFSRKLSVGQVGIEPTTKGL